MGHSVLHQLRYTFLIILHTKGSLLETEFSMSYLFVFALNVFELCFSL
jgi:hypothetical protein